MKYTKFFILISGLELFICSCTTQRQSGNKRSEIAAYNKYLSSIINDTTYYEFSQFQIADTSIYPILDSVILWSGQCHYFDSTVTYLYSFRFGITSKSEDRMYRIFAHMSPAQAIGLIFLQTGLFDRARLCQSSGVFYYRNYLFAIPLADMGQDEEVTFFPFLRMSGNKLRIRAPQFYDEKSYESYLTFEKKGNGYKIVSNEICGLQLLIQ